MKRVCNEVGKRGRGAGGAVLKLLSMWSVARDSNDQLSVHNERTLKLCVLHRPNETVQLLNRDHDNLMSLQ